MNGMEKLIEDLREKLNNITKKEEYLPIMKAGLYPTTRNLQSGLYNTDVPLMAKKACEESTETLEAAVMYQLEPTWGHVKNLTQETLDTIQMCLNILNYLEKEGAISIPEEIQFHNKKIRDRGWIFDNNLSLKIINNEVEE